MACFLKELVGKPFVTCYFCYSHYDLEGRSWFDLITSIHQLLINVREKQ